tara:strand:- start:732 stop:1013 length:282 start_codon:yes stop_codon:yes gene_type:complete
MEKNELNRQQHLEEVMKFKGLQNAVTKRRWDELLKEGKEWEIIQEQLQLSSCNITELAGLVLASSRQMINEINRVDRRLERIEKTLKLEPLDD